MSLVAVLVLLMLVPGATPAAAAFATSCGLDTSTAYNHRGGYYNNTGIRPNNSVFAATKADGSITAWGNNSFGVTGAPVDSGYAAVYPTKYGLVALGEDGSVTSWGSFINTGAPTDLGYVDVYTNAYAVAAVKADGSLTTWGHTNFGGSGGPTDNGYVDISSNEFAFAAQKADGSLSVWGRANYGGSDGPTDDGFVSVHATGYAFAGLKADGSISAWGSNLQGGSGAPTDSGYVDVYATEFAFAAVKADGSITAWGDENNGGAGAPTDSGYVEIHATRYAFAALKTDGSITTWGNGSLGANGSPSDAGYVDIYSTAYAFAATKADGSITAWGHSNSGGSREPSDSGYEQVFSNETTFVAMKADGSLTAWGDSASGASTAPTDTGYQHVYSTQFAFAAIKADGSITAWGHSNNGGQGAPSDAGYVNINGARLNEDGRCYRANSAPTAIAIDPATIDDNTTAIDENTVAGTTIGTLSTEDADIDDAHTYALVPGSGDEDNSRFTVDGNGLNLNFSPDFEAPTDLGGTAGDNTYSVRISTDDGNGGAYEEILTISVLDVDETPPVVTATVTGDVFLDANRNGSVDADEASISGVTVRLLSAGPDETLGSDDDVVVATAITASPYVFEDVVSGHYWISVDPTTLPSGTFLSALPNIAIEMAGENVSVPAAAVVYPIVSGTITDADGEPVDGATVVVTDSDGTMFTTSTDSDGRYTVEGSEERVMKPGEATLEVTFDGQTTAEPITIQGSSPDPIDLQLDPTVIAATFDLALTKTLATGIDVPALRPGDTVVYTLTIVNQGQISGANVTILDHIPAGLTLTDSTWTDRGNGTASRVIAGPIEPGTSLAADIRFSIDADATGTIVNTAEIADADPVDAEGRIVLDHQGLPVADIDSVADEAAGGDEDDDDVAVLSLGLVRQPETQQSETQQPETQQPESQDSQQQEQQLAFTGFSTAALTTVAAALVLLGTAMTARAQRTRRRDLRPG